MCSLAELCVHPSILRNVDLNAAFPCGPQALGAGVRASLLSFSLPLAALSGRSLADTPVLRLKPKTHKVSDV